MTASDRTAMMEAELPGRWLALSAGGKTCKAFSIVQTAIGPVMVIPCLRPQDLMSSNVLVFFTLSGRVTPRSRS